MARERMPNIDFRRIPRELSGLWVVVRLGDDQEIVAQGDTPREAVLRSKIDPDDSRYALTQVPDDRPGVAWITHPASRNVSR